ncbi:MAG: hypothetical protein NZ821_03345 [Gloeomargarita sp. SKYB31]|nr:hypothetical protein [Gloeomargarita sp. SKYB31]
MTWLVGQLPCRPLWRGVILVLLLTNPAFLIMLLTSPSWTAASLFLGLALLLGWHLVQPRDLQYPLSANLILLGLVLTPLMLLRYEFWWLLPIFMLLSWYILKEPDFQLRLTVVLVTNFMPVIAILGFMYVNWLIARDGFYFLTAPGNGLRWPGMERWLEFTPGIDAIVQSVIWLGQTLPVYYLVAILVLWQSRSGWVARFLLLILPLLIVTVMLWQGNYFPQMGIIGAFSILVPILLLQLGECRTQHLLPIILVWVVSIYLVVNGLQTQRLIPEEELVWRQMTGQPITDVLSARWRRRQIAQQEIAQELFQRLRPEQKVLLDDSVNFSIVYLLPSPNAFVLPHQYEFGLALTQPEEVVDYILVQRQTGVEPLTDRIARGMFSQERRLFTPVASNEFYSLFQRQ